MNGDDFKTNTNEPYRIRPLRMDEVDTLTSICDLSVGENLYTREELASCVNSNARQIYLAVSEKNEVMGYIYFEIVDAASVEFFAKLPSGVLSGLCNGNTDTVGHLKSIGVLQKWRNSGVAKQLAAFALEKVKKRNASIAVAACWKHGDSVPMQKNMEALGFQSLPGAYRLWYDHDRLICPFCNGRCQCEAVIYYTLLK